MATLDPNGRPDYSAAQAEIEKALKNNRPEPTAQSRSQIFRDPEHRSSPASSSSPRSPSGADPAPGVSPSPSGDTPKKRR